jgi:hypothetical protein
VDIASIFDYEQTFPLELVNPTTDEKIGITLQIRSAESDEAKKVQRSQIDDMLERQQRGKLIKGEQAIGRELDKAVSFVASWDWGGNTYKGEALDFSAKNVRRVLSEQGWIFGQVTEAANSLRNFTTGSQTTSAKGSDKKSA